MRTPPRIALLGFAGALTLGCSGDPSAGGQRLPDKFEPEPSGVAPAALLDLSHWQLVLPVDASGGTGGTARTVTTQELLDGYSSDWFYGTAGDGVTFWAPADGASANGASVPRSELREVINPADPDDTWRVDGFGDLTAYAAVHEVPADGLVTIAQVVGRSGSPDEPALARLVFEYADSDQDARLYALVAKEPGAEPERVLLLDPLHLNETFTVSLRVHEGTLSVGSGNQTATFEIGKAWRDEDMDFRAGARLHSSGAAGSGALVTYYGLDVLHTVE